MNTPSMTSQPLQIRPLAESMCAEVVASDVRNLGDAQFAQVRDALARYHLVVIRDQDLTEQDIETFARRFGEIEQHVFRQADGQVLGAVHRVSNLDANGNPSVNPYLNANYYWHSDKAYMPQPAWITLLYGVEIPPVGGDTQFANMAAAYESLPPALKSQLEGLRVVNCFDHMLETTGNHHPRSEEDKKKSPPVEHPLVRVDPVTGQKSLFVTMYAKEVVGMPPAESRALLDQLLAHATRPENVYTFKWRPRDLLFWDNRHLNHRAVANYDMNKVRRVLQRVVIKGH